MDVLEDIIYYIKRYFFPVLFLIAGFFTLMAAVTPQEIELNNGQPLLVHQEPLFMWGSIIMILGSIVWILYLMEFIKTMIGYGIMAVMAIGAAFVLYYDYAVVQEQVEFNNMYAERETEIKVRILDIKAAELAFKEVHEVYTNDMGTLINFVKTGKKMDYVKNGTLPDRKISVEERDLIYGDDRPIDFLMTDEEGAYLARLNGGMLDGEKFQRDTVFISVMEAIFDSERYQKSREKLGAKIAFHADSLQFVPFSVNPVFLDTASVSKGEYMVPTLLIKMTHPMEHPINGFADYSIGSVKDNHLRESWD